MKMRFLALSIASALAFGSASCSKDPAATAKPEQQQSTASEGHAPKDVKPGSHEDWCDEHAVPESQCTRCNTALIPAFKATGDWCEEHGLPESQCLKCNPEIKIVRPPKGS